MPALVVFDDQTTFVTDPVSPCAGRAFTVSWQERNIGDEDSSAYNDIFDMDDGEHGDSQTLECDPVPAGASVTRSLSFELPAGDYVMTLVMSGIPPRRLGNVIIRDCN